MKHLLKTLFTCIVLIIVVGAGVGFYMFNKPHKNVVGTQADIKLNAKILYDQYLNNETDADKRFLDKVVEVKGEVAASTREGNSYFILLKANDSGIINCAMNMKDTNLINAVMKGQTIIVKGKCTGFLKDVNLTDCVIN